mmetsp:Transcript_15461/g.44730  ORF Transcript_15461/g.44730 Transcript_15461/m.44730 type:complete len:284 (+) Transcript_15461:1245-2096(+)
MNGYLIVGVHLIELINATDAIIGKHKGSSFDAELASVLITSDGRRETCCTRCLAGSVNRSAGEERVHVLEELRLGRRGITNDTHVDIATQTNALGSCLVHPAKKHKKNTTLDLVVTKRTRADRGDHLIVKLRTGLHPADLLSLVLRELHGNLLCRLLLVIGGRASPIAVDEGGDTLGTGPGPRHSIGGKDRGGHEAGFVRELPYAEAPETADATSTAGGSIRWTSARSATSSAAASSCCACCHAGSKVSHPPTRKLAVPNIWCHQQRCSATCKNACVHCRTSR